MTHLTSLDIDTLVAELPLDAMKVAHVGACAECAARVARLRAEAEGARATVGFARGRARVAALRPRSRWRLAVPALAAPALALALALALPRDPDPETRTKGTERAWLVRAGESQPTSALRVGDVVRLEVAADGFVALVDDEGLHAIDRADTFRVTRGDLVLLAIFADGAIDVRHYRVPEP